MMPEYMLELCEAKADPPKGKRGKPDRWYWFRVAHRNGNIIMTSETYTRKATRTRIANRFAKATGLNVDIVARP